MKKEKKIFDSVQMVRELRDAMFDKAKNPNFEEDKFIEIRKKWSKLLKMQRKVTTINSMSR